uniref:Uncharacterized protein n=1 Tax=Arundo donax TaxID=35708 RepID=A0A0A8XYU8_ARUDO
MTQLVSSCFCELEENS